MATTTNSNGFNITSFRNALQGGSRPNLFKVRVTPPEGINNLAGFEFLCRSAQLPSATVGLIEVPMNGGRRLKMAGDRVFAEWTTTVLNDENFLVRSSLEKWQNSIVGVNYAIGSVGNRQFKDNDLYSTVQVYQMNDSGAQVAFGTAQLINCWPSDISTIDLSYDTTDTVEEFSVTWVYDFCVYNSDNTPKLDD